MTKPVLQFDHVTFHYGKNKSQHKVHILDRLNLDIYQGEFVSIIGPSGCGKSTLFRLITGLEQPNEGNILINGNNYPDRLGHVGFMPQQDLLMPWRTIIDNVTLPLEIQGKKKEMAKKQALELLHEFGLKGFENRFPKDLSGGMKQRVSFLRTILTGSNVLLLDEPFSALDAITRLSMQEWLLEQWKKWKKTIVFITHDVNEALFLSDRIFVFIQNPVHRLEEVVVPLKRPRKLADINQPHIIQQKEQLIDQLRGRIIQ